MVDFEPNDQYDFFKAIKLTSDGRLKVSASGLTSTDELSELLDVNIPAPTDGQVLTYDTGTSKWIAETPSGGSVALNDLTDVVIATPTDGQVLTYDSGTSEWKNESLPAASVSRTIMFSWLNFNPADATTYRPIANGRWIYDTGFSGNAKMCRIKLAEAKTTFYLNISSYVDALSSNHNITVQLNNFTQGTTATFGTINHSTGDTIIDSFSTTLSCNANDEVQLYFVTPTWSTNPTQWMIGAYLTF